MHVGKLKGKITIRSQDCEKENGGKGGYKHTNNTKHVKIASTKNDYTSKIKHTALKCAKMDRYFFE